MEGVLVELLVKPYAGSFTAHDGFVWLEKYLHVNSPHIFIFRPNHLSNPMVFASISL